MIPKVNLTGSNTERVDTRVLQVIYALPDERPMDVYVGQQMDVYLEAATPLKGLNLDASPNPPDLSFQDEPTREPVVKPIGKGSVTTSPAVR